MSDYQNDDFQSRTLHFLSRIDDWLKICSLILTLLLATALVLLLAIVFI